MSPQHEDRDRKKAAPEWAPETAHPASRATIEDAGQLPSFRAHE